MSAAPEHLPPVPRDTFGVRCRILRHHLGDRSIDEMSALCDVKPATWSTWEREVSEPRHLKAMAAHIAGCTGVSAEWLEKGGPLTPPDPRPSPVRSSRHAAKRSKGATINPATLPATPADLPVLVRTAA